MTMPVLKAGRSSKTDDLPVIDNTLNAYAPNAAVFACPADTGGPRRGFGHELLLECGASTARRRAR